MSGDVFSRGLMAPVLNPPKDPAALFEVLDRDRSELQISYDGTVAFIAAERADPYGVFFDPTHAISQEYMGALGISYGLELALDEARPFSCTWYNGADSPMSLMTSEDFLQLTEQE